MEIDLSVPVADRSRLTIALLNRKSGRPGEFAKMWQKLRRYIFAFADSRFYVCQRVVGFLPCVEGRSMPSALSVTIVDPPPSTQSSS